MSNGRLSIAERAAARNGGLETDKKFAVAFSTLRAVVFVIPFDTLGSCFPLFHILPLVLGATPRAPVAASYTPLPSTKSLTMSAILSADDLNDFISPGVACIKPIETLPVAPAGGNSVRSLASRVPSSALLTNARTLTKSPPKTKLPHHNPHRQPRYPSPTVWRVQDA